MNRNWIPDFSLVHPTARPTEWRRTRDLWIAATSPDASVEYVVCADWEQFGAITPKDAEPARLVWNYGKACSVNWRQQNGFPAMVPRPFLEAREKI